MTGKRKTGAILVECGQCRARGGLVEWDPGRKTWVCPSCETGIWAYPPKRDEVSP